MRHLLLMIVVVAGCGKQAVPTYRVLGTLKYQGTEETVPGARVEMRPENPIDPEHRVSAVGMVREDGTIQFTTFEPNDGAVEATHHVMISEPPLPMGWDFDEKGPPPPKIPQKYKNFESSGISVEVAPGGENRLDIEIEKPGH